MEENNKNSWIRPWNIVKFDDLYNRDDRFFSVLLKGLISWLNNNIILYNKPINHFIYNTGSSYMYMETNGYFYSWNETSGEDQMYMQMPRCIIEMSGINIPTEELTSAYPRGTYEHRLGNDIRGFNAQIRRIPIELEVTLKYVLSNFNESIVLVEEIINKILFQRYFSISFLGEIIKCSIEFPANFNIELNRIDMTDPTTNQKNVQLALKICSNYPSIDETTEISNDKIISAFRFGKSFYDWTKANPLILATTNGNIVKVHVNDDQNMYDENENNIEEMIINKEIINEFGEPLNKNEILKKFEYSNNLSSESTLFFEDISNTVDIISRDKIFK